MPTAAQPQPPQNPANNAFKVPALPTKPTAGQGAGKKRKLPAKSAGAKLAEPAAGSSTEQHDRQQQLAQLPPAPKSQPHLAKSSSLASMVAPVSKVHSADKAY